MSHFATGTHPGYTASELPESCHVCLIYDDDAQRRRVVSAYLTAGLQRGELVRYFTDGTSPEEVRGWIEETGLDVSKLEETGAFAVSPAESAYCPRGHFEPPAMIEGSKRRYVQAQQAGYPGTRACGEMGWVFRGLPGSDRLLEYEVLLNTVDSPFPHSGMCQYDARRFDGATLFRLLQVHPYVIVGGQVVHNPYYVKPEDFLATHPF